MIIVVSKSQKTVHMVPQEDLIVEIPENRLKFFGGAGKMLLPSPTTVAALIKKIPVHKLITTGLLCKELTEQFKVRGTCPVTTQKALQKIAYDSATECPYWRVVNANGGLIARFPGGTKGQAALLRKEGFAIDTKQKVPKVKSFSENLVRFDWRADGSRMRVVV
jgi:alkylated DNA nucleotide flippase Atl1